MRYNKFQWLSRPNSLTGMAAPLQQKRDRASYFVGPSYYRGSPVSVISNCIFQTGTALTNPASPSRQTRPTTQLHGQEKFFVSYTEIQKFLTNEVSPSQQMQRTM